MTGNQQIDVDLLHVGLTRDAMAATAEHLSNGLRQVDTQIQHEVSLGLRSPSGELDAARRALREALRVHATNSGNHIAVANHLASTIKIVLDHYQSVDEITKLDVQRMQAHLEEALPPRPTAKHWVEQ